VSLKQSYRKALDGVSRIESEHDAVITEAKLASVRNQNVFADLNQAACYSNRYSTAR
jgi:heme oxygenase